jgi:hypothetical protein
MSRVNTQLKPGKLIFEGPGFGEFDENGHPNANGWSPSSFGSEPQRRAEVKRDG